MINAILGVPLGYLMTVCYTLVKNYGLAIIIFTVLTKIILIPISIWVHKNGIKIVKLQPELNCIKAKYFGDGDQIAEETAALYKRAKYNPFASIIPLLIQIVLLIGLVNVIYHPLDNILQFDQQTTDNIVTATQIDTEQPSVQLAAIDGIKSSSNPIDEFAGIPTNVLSAIQSINLSVFDLDLTQTPSVVGGVMLLVPLLAGLATLFLCLVQNKLNPLQAEQGVWGKFGTTAFSVGLSLFLGAFVPAGVGFYWIWSNLFTIVQQCLLNWLIDPRKAIDYTALEKSKQELVGLQSIGGKKKLFSHDPNAKREKADYKRFFSIANKHLVFYSEKSGFYKYFKHVIEYLLKHSNVTIHYITNDPNDAIFELSKSNPKIKSYYIGVKKLITLFMKMDADIVVMTMPDLENFHYKRSYLRKDIEYIYMFHYPLSTHMVLHKDALDHYDTIFCVGEFQFDEIRQTEAYYSLPKKQLCLCGYGQLEDLYERYQSMSPTKRVTKKILIAPSWQESNILDSCIDDILKSLLGQGFLVVVRPHPEYVKRYGPRMDALVKRYENYEGDDLKFELDFSSNNSLFDSDLVVTDWSGAAYEFSLVTQKPSLFINTPAKINNPEYDKISAVPLELSLRSEVGTALEISELTGLANEVHQLLDDREYYSKKIDEIRNKYIANFGSSGKTGATYILKRLKEKSAQK